MIKQLIIATCMILGASLVIAEDNPIRKVEGAADLEKVKRARFRETYVNTNIDFTRYSRVYLGDAHFDYRDVGAAKRYRSNTVRHTGKSEFGISEKDRRNFERLVDEAFIKELNKGKFEIVETLDANTMIMRGAVVDIVSRVPPEYRGSSEVYLANVGEATLVLEFLDGSTGEVLARIAERGRIGGSGGHLPANSVTINSDIRRWAASAAKRLRSELDYAMGL